MKVLVKIKDPKNNGLKNYSKAYDKNSKDYLTKDLNFKTFVNEFNYGGPFYVRISYSIVNDGMKIFDDGEVYRFYSIICDSKEDIINKWNSLKKSFNMVDIVEAHVSYVCKFDYSDYCKYRIFCDINDAIMKTSNNTDEYDKTCYDSCFRKYISDNRTISNFNIIIKSRIKKVEFIYENIIFEYERGITVKPIKIDPAICDFKTNTFISKDLIDNINNEPTYMEISDVVKNIEIDENIPFNIDIYYIDNNNSKKLKSFKNINIEDIYYKWDKFYSSKNMNNHKCIYSFDVKLSESDFINTENINRSVDSLVLYLIRDCLNNVDLNNTKYSNIVDMIKDISENVINYTKNYILDNIDNSSVYYPEVVKSNKNNKYKIIIKHHKKADGNDK